MSVLVVLVYINGLGYLLLLTLYQTVASTNLCKTNILPAKNFDPKKYFKGKWFLTATKFYLGDITDVCEDISHEISRGAYIIERTMHYFGETDEFLQSLSITNMEDFNDGLANYNVLMKYENKNCPDELFNLKVTILDTDYTNYSIRYSCISTETGDIGNYYIYKRHKDDEIVEGKINQLIDKEGLDYKKFIFRKEANCKFQTNF